MASDWASFNWQDPFLMDEQLSEEERLIRDSARQYAQEKLLPRVQQAFRSEHTDREIFNEMGELGLLGSTIDGYGCAAKAYTQPNEDTTKPVVILVHGNSSGVTSYEEYFRAGLAGTEITNNAGFAITVDTAEREQLASKLIAQGYRVIGFDGVPILDTASPLSDAERRQARDILYTLSDSGLA